MGNLRQIYYSIVISLLCFGLTILLRVCHPTRHRLWMNVIKFLGKWWWNFSQRFRSIILAAPHSDEPFRHEGADTAPTSQLSIDDIKTKLYETCTSTLDRHAQIISLSRSTVSTPEVDRCRDIHAKTECEEESTQIKNDKFLSFIKSTNASNKVPVFYQKLIVYDSRNAFKNPIRQALATNGPKIRLNSLAIVEKLRPVRPLVLCRPGKSVIAAQEFLSVNTIQTMYAVKANDNALLLSTLWHTGIHRFEVASIFEIKDILHSLPSHSAPSLCFMNPVKPQEDIRSAYFDYNVRAFALQPESELEKIVRATFKDNQEAQDLELFVRLLVSSGHAKLNLNTKFGIEGLPAIRLLQRLKREGRKIGVCFHVGSQVTDSSGYTHAIREAHQLLTQAEVQVRFLSVGGGFGVTYPGNEAPSVTECLEVIIKACQEYFKEADMEILCEPGRALSAKSESLVVRVEERRGQELYINAGCYHILYDAGNLKWRFEVKLLRAMTSDAEIREFVFWGPTCDSLDYMPGPFLLPEDVREGDYLEIMNTGAYGRVLASRFNGLGEHGLLIVDDHSE